MIPDMSDPRWRRVLTNDSDVARASLATRILLTRLRGEVRKSPGDLPAKIVELHGFITKNSFAQGDVALF
jgi:hypothetical protein